eukprot:13616749-Ditylum_brightwellii.AAC.1
MKVTTPESCRDNIVQMETSPAVKDLVMVPSVDASIQQTSPYTAVEIEYNIVPPKPTTDNMFTPLEEEIPMNETDTSSSQEEMGNAFYTSPHEHQANNKNVHESLSAWFKQ